MPRYKHIELSPHWEEIYRRFKAVDEHFHGRFLPAFVNHLRCTFRVMAMDNPEIRTVADLFRFIEKLRAAEVRPQDTYWCGMDRQKMLKREKDLGLRTKERSLWEKVSNK